jgi:DNA polymerase-3 subunit epsilon/ATP-dependent DNA helicase DinG
VDIPGKDLEMLFIHKFPFAVPTDPVIMARSKLFRDPFSEYSVPQMLLKLRQGIGRLIRTKEDRGVIVILDGRIGSSWGKAVPGAFPSNIRIKNGTMDAFAELLEKKRMNSSAKASEPGKNVPFAN